jgi:hypothetical protein
MTSSPTRLLSDVLCRRFGRDFGEPHDVLIRNRLNLQTKRSEPAAIEGVETAHRISG